MKRILLALTITATLAPFVAVRGEEGELKWKYKTNNWVYSSPAVAEDGTIYVGSYDNHLHAVNPEGEMKWKFPVSAPIWSAPAIAVDGTVYFGSEDTYVYAVNPDGGEKWRYKTGGAIQSSAAIAADGTIYIGSTDTYLYALNPDGSLRWKYKTSGEVNARPSIGQDGTVYFGSYDTYFYAVSPGGVLSWSYQTGDRCSPSPSFDEDGTVYMTSFDGFLYAFRPDGQLKWMFATGDDLWGSVTIGEDGTIYFASLDDNLYALDPNGILKWSFVIGDNAAAPTIGNDGVIYIGSINQSMYAINPDGTLRWEFPTGNRIGSAAAIVADGTLYFGSYDTYLYALECSSTGLAQSPWPKYRRDNRNNSRADQLSLEVSMTEVDNADGMMHPGETSDVLVTILNTGEGVLTPLSGILSTGDTKVEVVDSAGSWGPIEQDEDAVNSTDPFSVRLKTDGEDGYQPSFSLYLEDELGHEFSVDFQLFTPAGVIETVVGDDTEWQVITTVGKQIVLQGPEDNGIAELTVFNTSGRKVERIHLTGSVTWGQGHRPGVYFFVPDSDATRVEKAVLIR